MNKNQVEKVIWWALKNLLGNLLPFIPFGFLLPIAYPRIKAFFKVFLVGMFAVLFIEIFQYMTRLGSFDIDDIILNQSNTKYYVLHPLRDIITYMLKVSISCVVAVISSSSCSSIPIL